MEQLEQLLTCCVCLDRYRNPKLLPCQHSFCMEPCMEGLVDYVRRQVKCPECRAEHRIPYQGVQAFPTNVTLQRFLELHVDLTGELPDPTSNQIMERCQVCSEKAYLNPCAHCEKKVCPDCKEAHLDVIKREITRMSSQVRRVLTRLEDALSVTDRNLAGLKGNHGHVLDEVDDLVRRFTKAIHDKGSALRNELESYVSSELATLNTYKTNLETEINNIQSNCDLVDKHMINEGSTISWDDQELMDTKDIFLKTIEFIRNFEYEPGDRRIRFSTTQDPNTVIVGLSNFGDLVLPHSFIVTTARQPPFAPPQQQLQAPSSGIMRSKSDHRLVQQYRDMDDMDDRPAGRERKFRSRFARHLMGQDSDDGRVRFDNDTEDKPQTSTKTRVIDTEDAVKGPMSAIPRMSDSTRVLEKLVEFESPKKKPVPAGPAVPIEIQQQMQMMQQRQQQQQQQIASNASQPPPRRQVSQEKSNQQSAPKPAPVPAPAPAPASARTQSTDNKPRTESESSTEQSSSSSTDVRNKNAPTAPSQSKPKAITPQSSTVNQSAAKPSPSSASSAVNNSTYKRTTPQASRSRDDEEESESSSEESDEESESDEPVAPARTTTTTASERGRDRDPPQASRSRPRDSRSQVDESPRSREPVDQRRFSRDEGGGSSGYQYRTRQQSPAERPYGSGSGSSASSRYGTSTSSPSYETSGLSRSRTGTTLYEPPEVPVPTSRLQAKYLNRARLNNMGGSVDIPDDYRSSAGKPYYSGRNAYLTKHGENKGDDERSGRDRSSRQEKAKILSRSKSSHELAQAELVPKSPEEEQQNLSSWARYLKSKYGKTVATGSNKNNLNNSNSTTNNDSNNQQENNNNNSDDQSNITRGKSSSPSPKINNPIANQYSGKKRLVFKFGARGSDPGYFTWPRGIACGPDGSIVVADSSNHRIQVFDAQGTFMKDFGTYGNGDGEFDCLAGVAVNRIGQFIVSDRYNHRIQVFDPSGRFLRSFGSQGSTDGKFNYPWGVTTDALGFIYVCDKENHRIQVFQSDGTFVGKFGVGDLEHPHYIAVTCTNKVVVSDTGHHRIYICDVNGKFIGSIGTEGIEHGQFKLPRGVAVDEQGYIFVGDSGNNRIQIFNPDGVHIKSFGGWGSSDGEFKGLEGIAVNSNGNVLVCDRENHRIQVF